MGNVTGALSSYIQWMVFPAPVKEVATSLGAMIVIPPLR